MQQPIREKGLSNFDTPHKFRSSFSYELPFGKGKWIGGSTTGLWQHIFGGFNLSGTVTRQSGYPGVVYLGNSGWFQSAVAGAGNDGFSIRPNIKPGVPLINPTFTDFVLPTREENT